MASSRTSALFQIINDVPLLDYCLQCKEVRICCHVATTQEYIVNFFKSNYGAELNRGDALDNAEIPIPNATV